MKLRDILHISLTNTLRNMKKTLLSSVAVAIGVASLVLISAVGNGAYVMAEAELSKLGIDGLSLRLEDTEVKDMDASYAELLEQHVPGVQSAMPFKLKYGCSRLLKTTSDAVIWGVGNKMIETMDLKLLYGREITASDVASNARVAVIDEEYAFQAYRRANIVGKTIRLYVGEGWGNYEIVGVIRSQTEALNAMIGTNIGAFVYVPYTAVNESVDESGIDQIAIRCKDEAEPGATARAAEAYMSRVSPTDGRYVAENITGYLERVKGIVRLIKLLVTAIGGISLIVAGVGVMNGMLAGIEERRREIGIYLAVGAIPRDIIENVLLEAIFICILGGCAGCLLGVLGAAAVGNFIAVPCMVSAADLFLAIGISGVCGVLFGTVPAMKAAHLDPIKALNRE